MSKAKQALKIDGLPVHDATKSIVLSIGALDVPKSKERNPASCAAARACIRTLDAEAARVHLSRIYIKLPGKKAWLRFRTPGSLRSEIIAFDRGGRFVPGEFTLDPLTASDRRDNRRADDARRRHDKGRKTGKKRTYRIVEGVRSNGHEELSA